MSRVQNFVRGLFSSYLALGANTLYSLLSVPLVLSYLSKEEFAIWALIMQVSNYAALLDLGMRSSMGRLLVDHKDNKSNGVYGSFMKASMAAGLVQGLIVIGGGLALAPFLGEVFALPQQYRPIFLTLFCIQIILMGLTFVPRALTISLYAHQRYDISNVTQTGSFLVLYTTLWLGLKGGLGLYSMALAGIMCFLWEAGFEITAAWRLKLLPKRGEWGQLKLSIFREIFGFGKDLFLMGLGAQMINASPVLIITRILGLEAAATWAICTKAFNLLQQLVFKVTDYSVGAFAEMYARGEMARLAHRFRDSVTLTASVSVFFAVPIILLNHDFVEIWTRNAVSWSPVNDLAMGLFLFVHSITRCHGGFYALTKKIGFGRYIYFIEGLFFLALSLLFTRQFGILAIIVSFIIADAIPTGYGMYRTRRQLGFSYREMILGWQQPAVRYLALFVPGALALRFLLLGLPLELRFILTGSLLALLGAVLFYFVGVGEGLKADIKRFLVKVKIPG